MLFRQLFDQESSTYTYLLADEETREALLIDPVLEQVDRDLELVSQLGLTLVHVLDTHVHADHVTAATRLREVTGARTVSSRAGAACADLHVDEGDVVRVGRIALRVLPTPGHTDDSVSYLLVDPTASSIRAIASSRATRSSFGRPDGRTSRTATRVASTTRSPGALFSLPDATLVYPAHDYRGRTVTTIGEEKRWNERIAGRSRDEFIAVMNALHLPEPKRLREAVPANLACGRVPMPIQG